MKFKLTKDSKYVKYTEEHGFITESDTISIDSFRENVNLTSVRIPDGITRILEGTFEGCVSLTSITIPATVKVIERNAFAGCHALKSIKLAKSIVEIEHWYSKGVKMSISKKDLVDFLKKGEEVNLLTEDDIDHWA